MMELSVREMVNGEPTRLRNTFRYSTSRVHHPESVAEHSYYVALYCLLVGRWVNENSVYSDTPAVHMGTLMERALLHDLEEARSGDFPRDFKHSSPVLHAMLENAGRAAFLQVTKPLVGSDTAIYMCEIWKDSKDDTKEGMILEFCDFLSVLSFMMQEKESGNSLVEKHVANMDNYFETFNQPRFDFIRPLIKQASDLMEEVF